MTVIGSRSNARPGNNERIRGEFLADGSDHLVGRLKKLPDPRQRIDLAVRTARRRDVDVVHVNDIEASDAQIERYVRGYLDQPETDDDEAEAWFRAGLATFEENPLG